MVSAGADNSPVMARHGPLPACCTDDWYCVFVDQEDDACRSSGRDAGGRRVGHCDSGRTNVGRNDVSDR